MIRKKQKKFYIEHYITWEKKLLNDLRDIYPIDFKNNKQINKYKKNVDKIRDEYFSRALEIKWLLESQAYYQKDRERLNYLLNRINSKIKWKNLRQLIAISNGIKKKKEMKYGL